MTERTLRDLGWGHITDAIALRANTPRGAERARSLPLLPDRAAVEATFALIDEARGLLRRELAIPLGGVEEVRSLVERTQKGAVLQVHELVACANLARASTDVRRFLAGLSEEAPLLASMVQRLHDLSDLASHVTRTFEPSGALRDDASFELADYRRRARQMHERLKGRLEALLHEPEFVHRLQDNYYSLRNDRYVVPVQASFRSQVPGIVHNASNSGQTIFVEIDEIVPMGNELTIAESLAAEEERRVLAALSREVADAATPLLANAELLAQLDLTQAVARLSNDLDFEIPTVVEADAPLVLEGARHPLLVMQGKKVVPNTIVLGQGERALIISGPNAGGKTVSMTTVGLCLLMARAGLPVPARLGSRVPLVTGLTCTIGDAQDLSLDLSTFTAHLAALGEILELAGPGWLCLIDEIGSDTDPVEGAALATAVLEALADHGARVLVTTHLEEVKAFGLNDPRFVNGRVGLDPETLRPNYALELGAAGVSKAIDVAEQVGLPAAVIARARENLQGGGALTVALQKLEEEQRAVVAERDTVAAQLRDAEAERERLRVELERAEQARSEAELTMRREMAETYEQAAKQAAAVVAEIQADQSMQQAQQAQRLMRSQAEEQRRVIDGLEARGEAGATPGVAIEPGQRVKVPGLNQVGEVLSVDDEAALVAVGSLRTRVALAELVPLREVGGGRSNSAGKRRKRDRGPRSESRPTERRGGLIPKDATLDLRGQRADEAEFAIEAFLDQCFLTNNSPVLIIHGHGTGVLRQVVREVLLGSTYVDDFRPGEDQEGGTGVTVAHLRL